MTFETSPAAGATLLFGAYQLALHERLLFRNGLMVPLPPKAVDLLVLLVHHPGQVLSRERLLELLWPDTFVEESNLNYTISLLRKALGEEPNGPRFIETIPKRGYRFIAELYQKEQMLPAPPETASGHENGNNSNGRGNDHYDDQDKRELPNAPNDIETRFALDELEPVGGAVPLDSPFYLRRAVDDAFHAALKRHDAIVLINGPRQVGKTSLLARGLQEARAAGAQVVLTDFQIFNEADLASPEKLFFTLAELLARRLRLPVAPRDCWDEWLSPNLNFEEYVLQHVLAERNQPLYWGMDEIDRLFGRPYANDFFGLLRSWHNARALDPQGAWRNLTVALAYATEAHLFISDLNQSPFNVGTPLPLQDFTIAQVAELNTRYGEPLASEHELQAFYRLLGGNPYLVRRGLHELRTQAWSFAELAANTTQTSNPFSDHLRRILLALQHDAELCNELRPLLHEPSATNPAAATNQSTLTANGFFRLRSAGLLAGSTAKEARLRCELYRAYLREQLL